MGLDIKSGGNGSSSGIGGAIAGGALGIVGAGIGAVGQNSRERRAVNNQKKLNVHGREQAMKMWRDTNYAAQVDQMKKAGLNPSLMYGKGGGAGGTTAAGSGGSAPSPQPMELGAAMDGASRTAMLLLQGAQKRKLDAEAAKLEAELPVDVSHGVATKRNILQDTGNKAKQDLKARNHMEFEEGKVPVGSDTSLYPTEYEKGQVAGFKKQEVEYGNEMKKGVLMQVETAAKAMGMKLDEARINEIWHTIRQKWMQAGFKGLDSIISAVLKGGKAGK